ncbi:MAG: hypothetical protein Fur0041_06610 [Bacteroidia bacterium]
MKTPEQGRLPRLLTMLLIAAAFTAVAVKAVMAGITWDEAYSFFEFVKHPDLVRSDFNSMSANNHLLNTWLTKIAYFIFGYREWHLRLPNVLSFLLYAWAAVKVSRKCSSDGVLRLSFLGLLFFNPYVLDFFSLERGYGLSLAFMMSALYFFLKEQQPKNLLAAQLLLLTAVLANLTLLVVYAAMTGIQFIQVMNITDKQQRKRSLVIFAVIALTAGLPLFFYICRMQQFGAFYFGEQSFNLFSTFDSLAHSSAYAASTAVIMYPAVLIITGLAALLSVFTVVRSFPSERFRFSSTTALSVLFLLAILIPLLQHLILHSPLLYERTALFYWPLAVVTLFVLSKNVAMMRYGIITAAIAVAVHFSVSFSIHAYHEWRDDAAVKGMACYVADHRAELLRPEGTLLNTDLQFEQSWNYYRMYYNLQELGAITRGDANTCADLYHHYNINMQQSGTNAMVLFNAGNNALYSASHQDTMLLDVWNDFEHYIRSPQIHPEGFHSRQRTFANAQYPYSLSQELFIPDSLLHTGCATLTLSCFVKSATELTPALLVFAVSDKDTTSWHTLHVNSVITRENKGEWAHITWKRILPAGLHGKATVSAYLLNTGHVPVYLDALSVKMHVKRP